MFFILISMVKMESVTQTLFGDLGEIGTHELFLAIQDVATEIDAWDVVGVLIFIWLILRLNQMN